MGPSVVTTVEFKDKFWQQKVIVTQTSVVTTVEFKEERR